MISLCPGQGKNPTSPQIAVRSGLSPRAALAGCPWPKPPSRSTHKIIGRNGALVCGGGSLCFRFAFVVLKMSFRLVRDAWARSVARDYIS